MFVMVPVEEKSLCYFYFMTRAPVTRNYISTELFQAAFWSGLGLDFFELIILVFLIFITSRSQIKEIAISEESAALAFSYSGFAILSLASRLIWLHEPRNSVSFVCILLRNLSVAVVPWYYSVYKVTNQVKKGDQQNHLTDLLEDLGINGIYDFSIAMKCQLPLKYFR